MKRLILFFLLLLFVTTINCDFVEAKKYETGSFAFEYRKEEEGVWITKITPKSNTGIETLHIPKELNGKKVVKIGGEADDISGDLDDDTNLFGVYIPEEGSGQCVPEKIHKRVSRIKKIHIPSTVQEITYHCFNYMQDGKSINIPKDVEENVEELARCARWSEFKISKKNMKYKSENGCLLSKEGGILYGVIKNAKRMKKLVIPNTVKTIPVFVEPWDVDEIFFPKGITQIEENGPTTKKSARVHIEKGSKIYAVKGGSIYNKVTGRLVSGYVKDGVLRIPSKVKLAGYANGYLGPKPSKIIFPSSVKKINQILGMTDKKKLICVCKGKKPPKLVGTEGTVTAKEITVYVPNNCKKIYEKKWKSKWKFIEEIKSVRIIEQ